MLTPAQAEKMTAVLEGVGSQGTRAKDGEFHFAKADPRQILSL